MSRPGLDTAAKLALCKSIALSLHADARAYKIEVIIMAEESGLLPPYFASHEGPYATAVVALPDEQRQLCVLEGSRTGFRTEDAAVDDLLDLLERKLGRYLLSARQVRTGIINLPPRP